MEPLVLFWVAKMLSCPVDEQVQALRFAKNLHTLVPRGSIFPQKLARQGTPPKSHHKQNDRPTLKDDKKNVG